MADGREVILASLHQLDDAALVRVLSQLLQSHPQVAPRIVNMACPDLTFVPTKALMGKRSLGIICQVGNDGGLIECAELEAAFGCAVVVARQQLGPYTVGQEVNFAVTINDDSKPQAFDLQVMPGLGAAAGLGVLPLPLLPLPGLPLPGATMPGATLPGGAPMPTLPGLPPLSSLPGGLPLPPLPVPGGLPLPGLPLPGLPMPMPPMEKPAEKPPPPTPQPIQAANGDQILGTFLGIVRNIDEEKGFGFIASDQLRAQGVSEDCYVHKHYLGREFTTGSEVSFTAFLDARNGRPRARDLTSAKGQVGPQSAMSGGGGEKDDPLGTYKGTVKSYNAAKGFGFIVCEDLQKEGWEGDVYLHQKHAKDMNLREGDTVTFEAFVFQGRLQGRNLMRIDASQMGTQMGMQMGSDDKEWAWDDWETGKGDFMKGKFKGLKGDFMKGDFMKGKGKGPVGLNPMAMNMMMAMMMGGKG